MGKNGVNPESHYREGNKDTTDTALPQILVRSKRFEIADGRKSWVNVVCPVCQAMPNRRQNGDFVEKKSTVRHKLNILAFAIGSSRPLCRSGPFSNKVTNL